MAGINVRMIKELREKTGAGMMNCKIALEKCEGDLDKSFDFLRKKGIATASRRSNKIASQGTIQSYIHMGGKIGVMVEANCETDFVAKTDEFINFTKNIAMHIAATNPMSISVDNISNDIIKKEREICEAQVLNLKKPRNIIDKIIENKIDKFLKENSLLTQQYVKDTDKTVRDYLNEIILKTGEKIEIKRFIRFQIGEG